MRAKILLAILGLSAVHQFAAADATAEGQKVEIDEVRKSQSVHPVDGVTSSGQPDEVALKVFADSGYTTIIDLRGPDEKRGIDEEQAVRALGMEYISMPVVGQSAISFDNAAKLDLFIENAEGPVLIHCGSGNRVGALLALRARAGGASVEESLELGKNAGLTRLEPVVLERLNEDE